jgi:predicted ATPase/class 3 adenylate cyclase
VRHDLPTGTVTFLFTDVERSTRLLEELGPEGYAEALGRHRDVIRSALDAHGGVEVDTQGDAFFCAFASARTAVACAADVQSALEETRVRVRVGVHTGEALVAGDHYVGIDVHRAARIGACGHGGQVVVSPSTVALLEPGSYPLRDLGQHRLKDLSAPVRLYQLGDGDFGPLKTLFRTNLPVPATEFLGRHDELRALKARASEPGVRLLTLVGPGGTGKTRLALQCAGELADAFPDGVFWVPLASLGDPALVASTAAQTLAVDERAGESLLEAIPRAVGAKRLLLLLDNCEHVLNAVADLVAHLLARAPAVLVVTTSRQPLGVTGEHVYAVEPLLPTDALSLFDVRARAAGATIDSAESRTAVEDLCERLDNLPLAVELAAAKTAAVPPAALLERLSSRMDVLTGPRDAHERQRTLRATIEWSHDLLDPSEQTLFRRLAVFHAGAGLDVVEDVCRADLEDVVSLVAQSLVRQTEVPGGEPRYWMLETIREFAASALEASGETETFRDRHLDRFAALARDARELLLGAGSTEWYGRLERDLENLRAALAWALERAHDTGEDATGSYGESAIALATALAPLHVLHGRYAEAEDVIGKAIALAPGPWDEVRLRKLLGRVLRQRGRAEAGIAAHLAAERVLAALETRDETWWEAWIGLKIEQAHHHYFQGDTEALAALVDELRPQVERHGSPLQELEFLHVLAQNAFRRERYVLSEETEALQREIHRRALGLGVESAHFTLGFALLWRGSLHEAVERFQDGLVSARRRGDALIEVRCLVYQVVANRLLGDVERARELLSELAALDDLHGYVGLVQANRAWIALRDRDLAAAAGAAEMALADWETEERSGPTVFQWTARFPMLAVELERGRLEAALEHARVMLDTSQQPLPAELGALVERAVMEGDETLLERALEAAAAIGYA